MSVVHILMQLMVWLLTVIVLYAAFCLHLHIELPLTAPTLVNVLAYIGERACLSGQEGAKAVVTCTGGGAGEVSEPRSCGRAEGAGVGRPRICAV